tara:strand:- start:3370 stop:4128 length:759 start_codon:yes stop_codon:yes gene_type:complete
MNISALIVARNEQFKISECLKSLNFVDEIVVILDRSEDNTKKIAKKANAKIFSGKWEFEGDRRNFGINKCKGKWILEIDADERVSKKLSKEIIDKIRDKEFDFYYVKLLNYIGSDPIKNGWMSCLAPDGKFLLFKKGSKIWKNQRVHPDFKLHGNKGTTLQNHVEHKMSKNVSELLLRFNRNTELKSLDLITNNETYKKNFSFRKIFSRFLKSFLLRKGYKEGLLGFLVSILNAIYPMVTGIKADFRKDLSH